MKQLKHPSDAIIIRLFQEQGCIKREAQNKLKKEVYQLDQQQIMKVKNYAEHFGISAKEKLIDEILDLRRERLISRLLKNTSQKRT